MSDAVITVSFKDMSIDEELRNRVEERCRALDGEFPELTHLEVTLTPDGGGFAASGHGSGKATRLATHANAPEAAQAADQVLDTLRHQLRKAHDKRIFAHRREAQRHNPKRS